MGAALLIPIALLAAGGGASPNTEVGVRAPAPHLSPDLRVHLVASEDLDADALAALSRPKVVLWLTTRSNALAPATADALARFGEAFVQVRPPLSAAQADTWARAPRAGLWLSHPGAWTSRWGPRPLAVEAQAAHFDDSLVEVRRLARVQWAPEDVDVATLGRLVQSRARVTLHWTGPHKAPSCEAPQQRLSRLTVRVRDVEEAKAWARCGFRVRVPVAQDLSEEAVAQLVWSVPGLELEVYVGADERRALWARRLLERLDASGDVGRARPRR